MGEVDVNASVAYKSNISYFKYWLSRRVSWPLFLISNIWVKVYKNFIALFLGKPQLSGL